MARDDRQVRTALQSATHLIREAGKTAAAGSGETPFLDAVLLFAEASGLSKEKVLASFPETADPAVMRSFNAMVERRCNGEPVSYILGKKEFYGREFGVGPGVLVPRPDTEILVETALGTLEQAVAAAPPGKQPLHVHDCCTGSGCVAVTLALEAAARVSASDRSSLALDYAKANALRHHAEVEFFAGDLLEPLRRAVADSSWPLPYLVTANPPYVADNEVDDLTLAGWPEPALALAGGDDGLAVIGRLAEESPACLADGGWLMVEIGPTQGQASVELFRTNGFESVGLIPDLAGRDRVCRGRWYSH